MKTTHYLRKTTTVVSGMSLLLALAGSAFATGGGHTAATNLHGVTITPDSTGECFTVSLANGGGTFSYGSSTDGTIAQINGLYIFTSPMQVLTTGVAPAGFTADTLNGSTVDGATGYKTSFGNGGKPILPGKTGTVFCFNGVPGTGATFLLDISQGSGTGPFSPTGRISFTLPASPSAVPEPSSVATLAVGSLGLMGMVLSARKRRRANDMI